GNALTIVSGEDVTVAAMIAAAVLLALFAILFGARRFELAGRTEGLLFAIALESVIKIVAMLVVAALAAGLIFTLPSLRIERGMEILAGGFDPARLSFDVVAVFVLSGMAIIALPRQFYMGLVEARDTDDLVRARWGLAAYVGAMALLVIPIALAGTSLFDPGVPPDLYVLQLPSAAGYEWVLAAALLGGVAAAASMAIVDSTALATMVSNDMIFPTVLRGESGLEAGSIGRRMLFVRRLSIVAIMTMALVWALLVSPTDSLASIGLIAFAAMAQFTPHLILAATGKGRDPLAARASIATGLVLWLYTLALPPILPDEWLAWLASGALDPLRLFGIGEAQPLLHGAVWSLGCNLAVLTLVAARKVPGAPLPRLLRAGKQVSDLGDLVQLTASFVGRERAEAEFPQARRGVPVDRKAARRAQELIARVVGASSARALVASALAGGQMSLADVTHLLDRGGQSLRFSRPLLAATFENMDAGISVVDADMNLVAWNSRYEEILDYPPGMVRAGMPIGDLIRHNALRGDFGPGAVEQQIEKRLNHLRRGLDHSFERHRKDGRVIKTVGGPMPGGGYVMSFTDITEEARMRAELRRTLEELESRVAERTRALSEANRRLAEADRDKTRFLAAASHDLLQPLHAARLFIAALERDVPDNDRPLVHRVESAIQAAEGLLRALLDISKLDAGGVQPRPEPLALAPFLTDLAESFRLMAQEKGLRLLLGPMPGHVHTDPGLLRSMIQNFLANAVRYCERGGVLVGVRRRGDWLRIDVVDTGVGIAADQVETVFGEFIRLGQVEVEGLGLGLALSERIARLLGGVIEVRSEPGRGSRFSLSLPALP
ncbi:MAG: PAS-domain containing protein, partial [Novosphingobium sp.]